MSRFTDNLTISPMDDGRNWRVVDPLHYDIGAEGSGKTVTVPSGFITDGASVPRILWDVVPPFGTYTKAAVLHDFLCRSIRAGAPAPYVPDLKTADGIFLEAMVVCGTGVALRTAMWAAVRVFGSLAKTK